MAMHICKKLSLKIKVKKKVQKENLALTNYIWHKQIDVFCHFVAVDNNSNYIQDYQCW